MKKYIEMIKELKAKPYGKAVLFFIIYFVFVVIVILLSRVSVGNKNSLTDYENSGSKDTININNISKSNYKFLYTINIDDIIYTYEGKKENDEESFVYNNENYIYKNNSYYNNGNLVENPYMYKEFMVLSNLNSLVNKSYLNYKTTYEDGRVVYNYFLSTNTVDKYFYNIDSDYDEVPNTINIEVNKDNIIITLDLSSYCKLNNKCSSKSTIIMKYSEFKR